MTTSEMIRKIIENTGGARNAAGNPNTVTVSAVVLEQAADELDRRPRSLGHVLGFWNDDAR